MSSRRKKLKMASVNTWVLSEFARHICYLIDEIAIDVQMKTLHQWLLCSLAQLLAENQVSLACKQGALWINDHILPLFLSRQDDCTEKRSRVAFFLLLVFLSRYCFCTKLLPTKDAFSNFVPFIQTAEWRAKRRPCFFTLVLSSITDPYSHFSIIPPFCSYTVTTYVSITLQLYTTYLCEFVK